jgi:hypothetical protein
MEKEEESENFDEYKTEIWKSHTLPHSCPSPDIFFAHHRCV